MLSYLTGARANELARPGTERKWVGMPREVNGKMRTPIAKTRSVGPLRSDVEYDTFVDPDTGLGTECVKIRLQVLKRKSKNIIRRIVALPLNESEPWARFLCREFDSLGPTEPLLDMADYTLGDAIREAGFYRELKAEENLSDVKNPLRHFRHNHLIEYYGLDPYQIHVFFGWGFGASGLVKAGAAAASSKYDHLNWNLYFKRLLKSLPKPFLAPVHEVPIAEGSKVV